MSEMQTGGVCPVVLALARCLRDASRSRSEESPALARAQGISGIPVIARQVFCFSGPLGGADRRDVLVATDADANSND